MAFPGDFEPHVLGPYFVLEPLAHGEVADVYRARATGAAGFQREIVLKKVQPHLARDPAFLDMLVHEAKLTSLLHHGNIAQVFELQLVDGELLLTMEYVDGITYGQFLELTRGAGQVPAVSEVCHVVAEACAALDYAHRKTDADGNPLGIVHCDLSPGNLMLSLEGVVKVLDFGLARVEERFGTPDPGKAAGQWASPEQLAGDAVDARADVYACGLLLYEGLSGQRPFPPGSDRRRAPAPLTGRGEDVPESLDAVVQRALAPAREARQPSCRHLAAELSGFVGEPALAAMALSRTLRTRLSQRLPQRRAERARDEGIVAELQRRSAVGPGSLRSDGGRLDPRMRPVPGARSPVVPPRRWPALVLGLCVGVTAGIAGALLVPRAEAGAAVVTADVPGAVVRVDREPRGRTPLELPALEPGRPLLVEVEAPGYPVYSYTFAPAAGSLTVVNAQLAAPVGSLRVETDPPGARLLVDGRDVGITPVTADRITLGVPHRFRLEREGSPPQEFTQVIDEAEPAPLRISLPREAP